MEAIYPIAEKKAIHPIVIFKDGFLLWKKNFLSLSAIYLIVLLPHFVLTALFPKVFIQAGTCAIRPNSADSLAKLIGNLVALLIGVWAFVALIGAIKRVAGGADCKVIESIKDAARRFAPCLGTMVLSGCVVAVPFLAVALGVPGAFLLIRSGIIAELIIFLTGIACFASSIYFFIRFSVGGIISVVEDAGPIGALKRSYRLTKNYVTPAIGELGLLLLLGVVTWIPAVFLSAVFRSNKLAYLWYYKHLIDIAFGPLYISILFMLYRYLKEVVESDNISIIQGQESRP